MVPSLKSRGYTSPSMEVTRKPHLHQDWIDSHAYGIVKALQKAGFETYLVGGCVRDLLLNIHPKDFDIATMAHPPQVKRIIYMAFIIGKRFRLVLVKRDHQQFEVATFRREVKPEDYPPDKYPDGIPFGDNVFGTPEEDARRRDFTINALFYDPIEGNLIDYVNGLPDIEARVLRMIGEPAARLIEDPIRILRGIRFAHKIGFTIEPTLRAAMTENASELQKSVLPRKREEVLKILRLDDPTRALLEIFDMGVLKEVLPTLDSFLQDPKRRELFIENFEAFASIVVDDADTTQLFGWLVYSLLRAAIEAPSERDEPITIEDAIFQRFMQDELGMYKFEQSTVVSAIQLLPSLTKTEEFKRRGERRQLGLMKNEGFRLALRIAEVDYVTTPAQLGFWASAFERLGDELEKIEADLKSKKKRRPRRRRRDRGDGDGAKASSDVNDSTDDEDDDIPSADDLDLGRPLDDDDLSPDASRIR